MATGAVHTRAVGTALALPIILSRRNVHDNSLHIAPKSSYLNCYYFYASNLNIQGNCYQA